MNATLLWRKLVQGLEHGPDHELLGILPEPEYRRLLAHERALADRHARHFSLLIFDAAPGRASLAFNAKLVTLLKRRLRETDVAGWFAGGRVGVILPHSDQAGAQVVADAVCAGMRASDFAVHCERHTYPEDATNNADGGRRMMGLLVRPLPRYKRALDIAMALVGLIVVSPLLLLVAAAIKLVSPGPVLFKQERVGHLGSRFPCWKFRTMTVAADAGVHRQHMNALMQADVPMTKLDQRHDARLIPLGKLLRAAGLDELPQLINVLRGEMSLVGPRPCIPYEFDSFQPWHKRRCDALPGLTGLWQVSGKNHTTFGEMMRLDVSYSRQQSLPHDLRIVWRTLPVLVEQIQRVLPRRAIKQQPQVALV